ncbi:MAG: hypothetical protein WKF70_11475 [Chitinophagaceae bacterium]
MKKIRLTLGIVSIVATIVIIYSVKTHKKYRTMKRLTIISDAGYETAHDVLYPIKYKRYRAYPRG